MRERDTSWDGVPAGKLGATELQDRAARNLVWIRELLFPSQAAAARAFGLNTVTYNRYETGERKISIPMLIELCDGPWELTLDYFYRSDLSGLPKAVVARLSSAHPVLVQECEPRGMPLAFSDQKAGFDTPALSEERKSSRATVVTD